MNLRQHARLSGERIGLASIGAHLECSPRSDASRVEGGTVRVSVVRGGGRLRILIENPFDPDSPSRPGTGIGLRNVRERLAARWGGEALFAAKKLTDRFLVVISVPAERAA